jgi:hypothetical protein
MGIEVMEKVMDFITDSMSKSKDTITKDGKVILWFKKKDM